MNKHRRNKVIANDKRIMLGLKKKKLPFVQFNFQNQKLRLTNVVSCITKRDTKRSPLVKQRALSETNELSICR